jgi:hypothetical protein
VLSGIKITFVFIPKINVDTEEGSREKWKKKFGEGASVNLN